MGPKTYFLIGRRQGGDWEILTQPQETMEGLRDKYRELFLSEGSLYAEVKIAETIYG